MEENEIKRLKELHRNISYTREESQFLLDMAKKYVDENIRVCFTCRKSISDLKQKLYNFFLKYLDENEENNNE